MESLTKKEMAEALVNSNKWDGSNDVDYLVRNYSKEILQDAYDMI